MIPVTKPLLPSLDEYNYYLEKIWSNNHLTNNGPLLLELEDKLRNFLKTSYCSFVSNGTVAIQIAIKALEVADEVITTPFSYVATTSSIKWEGCTPIFVDIEPKTLTLDPSKIQQAITPKTKAILATHVYGNPCDVEAIKEIADKNNIKVIYDAAHCFGVKYKNIPLVNYGNISTLSFHATKLFQTVEGGAVITNCEELAHKISYLRNFGHKGPEQFEGVGINGKNSEFHAAMGLCTLPKILNFIQERKVLSEIYDNLLLENSKIKRPVIRSGTEYNYSYYPIILQNEEVLLNLVSILNQKNVFPRRYFYPSLCTLNYVGRFEMPISKDISKRILCLPLYNGLLEEEVIYVSNLINDTIS